MESKEVESMDALRAQMIDVNVRVALGDLELIKIMDSKLRKYIRNYLESALSGLEQYFHSEEDGGPHV